MDDRQFAHRVADCENALKRFVYYRMPSKEDADDILQETLITAYIAVPLRNSPAPQQSDKVANIAAVCA